MKKLIVLLLALVGIFALTEFWKNTSQAIHITIPAGTTGEFVYQEEFIYSEEEISPLGKQLTLKSIDVSDRAEFVLMPIEVKEENAYERTYFTKGEPIIVDVEKGAWFKVGVAMENPTDEDIVVSIHVEHVRVRNK